MEVLRETVKFAPFKMRGKQYCFGEDIDRVEYLTALVHTQETHDEDTGERKTTVYQYPFYTISGVASGLRLALFKFSLQGDNINKWLRFRYSAVPIPRAGNETELRIMMLRMETVLTNQDIDHSSIEIKP